MRHVSHLVWKGLQEGSVFDERSGVCELIKGVKTIAFAGVVLVCLGVHAAELAPQKFKPGTVSSVTNLTGEVWTNATLIQADKAGLLFKVNQVFHRVDYTNLAASEIARLEITWKNRAEREAEIRKQGDEMTHGLVQRQAAADRARQERDALYLWAREVMNSGIFTSWRRIGDNLELRCTAVFRLLDLDQRKVATHAALLHCTAGSGKRVTFVDSHTGKEIGSAGPWGWKFEE